MEIDFSLILKHLFKYFTPNLCEVFMQMLEYYVIYGDLPFYCIYCRNDLPKLRGFYIFIYTWFVKVFINTKGLKYEIFLYTK